MPKTDQYNYKNPISLTDVADFVGLSPTYFHELFKKEEDINFIDYLIEFRRIKKAKHLLRYTDYKIYEVAREVGYKRIFTISVVSSKGRLGFPRSNIDKINQKKQKKRQKSKMAKFKYHIGP